MLDPVEDPDFSGDGSSKEYRKNWARFIRLRWTDPEDLPCEIPERGSKAAFHRVNEVDPLTCPKCFGKMKVISVVEDEDVIKKILIRDIRAERALFYSSIPSLI